MQEIRNRVVTKDRRKELRHASTDAELKFWHFVRGRRFVGLKFVRQFGIGPYILDFFCSSARLAIELDGGQHEEYGHKEYDRIRTEYLNSMRIRVMRFWNADVLINPEAVLQAVKLTLPPLDLKRGIPGTPDTPSSDEEGQGAFDPDMQTEKKKLGNEGEDLAARHLESKGYRILARQAGIPRVGEIDLIAYDPRGGEVVFVEVKTRRDLKYGPPEEAVTAAKLRRLMRVAETWRVRNKLYDRPWRVDVVAIELVSGTPVIRQIEGLSL